MECISGSGSSLYWQLWWHGDKNVFLLCRLSATKYMKDPIKTAYIRLPLFMQATFDSNTAFMNQIHCISGKYILFTQNNCKNNDRNKMTE